MRRGQYGIVRMVGCPYGVAPATFYGGEMYKSQALYLRDSKWPGGRPRAFVRTCTNSLWCAYVKLQFVRPLTTEETAELAVDQMVADKSFTPAWYAFACRVGLHPGVPSYWVKEAW